MENPEHLAIFKSGVDAWNNWREEHPEIQPNLSHADLAGKDLTSINFKNAVLTGSNLLQSTLTKANLVEANLSYALLFEANLETANLTRSDLMGADLAFSKLKEANLSQSVLRHANLTGCDLSGGILRKADLMYTVICSASLIGVDVTSASFLETIIVDTDLTKAKGLATCEHLGPSVIDYRTLLKSKTLPQTFLKACGIPFEIIEALMRAKGKFVS